MLTAIGFAAAASAWTLRETEEGDPLRWDRFPLDWQWGGGDLPGAPLPEVEAAFARWVSVEGTAVSLERRPYAGDALIEAPDDVHLVWSTTDWPFDDDLLALTSSWAEPSGELVAFDIRINGNRDWATDGDPDRFDLRAAMTHEVGHVLGLDHTEEESAAMYATTLPGELFRRELHPDDEEGLRFLYEEEPESSPRSCATAPGSALGAIALAALLARRGGGR